MTAADWHLAQLDIGRLVAPVDAPEIAGFVAGLEANNRIADAAGPGVPMVDAEFCWPDLAVG